jgi:SHS2 domain-containing protein
MRWEHFAHEADLGVRGYGRTPAEAFEAAALALTAAVTDPGTVATADVVEVECPGQDLPLLLYDWLNRIIYEMATRRLVFGSFHVELTPAGLRGRMAGERVTAARHAPAVEPKGATLTGLDVRQAEPGRWCAECIIDV